MFYCACAIPMDDPRWRCGRDERVPPSSGPDKQVPPKDGCGWTESEGHLSCPLNHNGSSKLVLRARQARPSKPMLHDGRDKRVPPKVGTGRNRNRCGRSTCKQDGDTIDTASRPSMRDRINNRIGADFQGCLVLQAVRIRVRELFPAVAQIKSAINHG